MAAIVLFGLTGLEWTTSLPHIPVLWHTQGEVPKTGRFGALSHLSLKAWCEKCQSFSLEEGKLPKELTECSWQQYFFDPTQWWDNGRSNQIPQHPDFRNKMSKASLWLDSHHKLGWMDWQLTTWDARIKKHPDSGSASLDGQGAFGRLAAHEGYLEVGMCRKLCDAGRITDSVDALTSLVQQGCRVPINLFYLVLKRCVKHKDLVLGRRVHTLTIESGYVGDAFLATHLIGLYVSHGKLEEAVQVITKVSAPNAYNWAIIMFAYVRHGDAAQAIQLYRHLCLSIIKPNKHIYVAALKACATVGDLVAGREIHGHILEDPLNRNIFVQTGLVDMYAKCMSLEDARMVFDGLSEKNVVTWTAMIAGYTQQGMGQEALILYNSMKLDGFAAPDSFTFACLLQACASVGVGGLQEGKELHAQIEERGLQNNVVLGGSLVNMYAKCGSTEDARKVFDSLPLRNVVTWTAMISGYAQQGMGQEALSIYNSMQQEGLTPPGSITFVCLLQACACVGLKALHQGKQLHAQIVERGLHSDVVLGSSLVNMYAKCGSLTDAHRVFEILPHRNVVTWTTMIAGYAQQGMGLEALSLYNSMKQEGIFRPDSVTFVCLLQACAIVGAGALHEGKQLHAQIIQQGVHDDVGVGGSIVNMYAKCGSLEDARSVFDRLPDRNIVTWTAMIAGYAQEGMSQEALTLYSSMQEKSITAPDSFTFACLLRAFASAGVGALHQVEHLHRQIKEQGLQDDVVLGTCLIDLYAKAGTLQQARCMFDRLANRDLVTWTVMIAGYVQHGMAQEALSLYKRMQQEGIRLDNSLIFVFLLQACAITANLALGRQFHTEIEERGLQDDAVLGGSLVNMYAKCGSIEDARKVFDKHSDRNIVTWNAMLAGYAQQGMGQEAFRLYSIMKQEGSTPPDSITFVCLLQACALLAALECGKLLHTQIQIGGLQEDVILGGSLVSMYAKCGNLQDARIIFDGLPDKNVVTWTAMIAGYAEQGMGEEALSLYFRMLQDCLSPPDSVTFVCLLEACTSLDVVALTRGKQLHAQIEERGLQDDVVVGGSLVNMYVKCGSLEDGGSVFDRLADKSVFTWNAMLAGYSQQGMVEEALSLYRSLKQEGITPPDSSTFVCLLQACAIVAALPLGQLLHAEIEEQGLQADVAVGAALVNMYAKCGSMLNSQQVFNSLPERTVEAWNALTGGYSRQGDCEIVFHLVDRMRLEGVQPDGVTFLSVLTACSHVGLVEKGIAYFEAMRTDYAISPTVEHYTCMMDLLGRAGHLEQALQMAKTMPYPPDSALWRTLLSACRNWNAVEIGQEAFELAVTLDGKDAASHVLMSNIYASAQMWDEAKEMQARRVKSGAWKRPGQSWWTDMGGLAHAFVVGNANYAASEDIGMCPPM